MEISKAVINNLKTFFKEIFKYYRVLIIKISPMGYFQTIKAQFYHRHCELNQVDENGIFKPRLFTGLLLIIKEKSTFFDLNLNIHRTKQPTINSKFGKDLSQFVQRKAVVNDRYVKAELVLKSIKYINNVRCIARLNSVSKSEFIARVVCDRTSLLNYKQFFVQTGVTNLSYVIFAANLVRAEQFSQLGTHKTRPYTMLGLDIDACLYISAVVTSAVNYLHENSILHAHLCPHAFEFDLHGRLRLGGGDPGSDLQTVIDLSRSLVYTDQPVHVYPSGMGGYQAPEQVFHVGYNRMADWFTVGLILYEVFHGGLPWDEPSGLLYYALENGYIAFDYERTPREAAKFVRGLLAVSPLQRLGLGGLKELKKNAYLSVALEKYSFTPPESVSLLVADILQNSP